MNVSLPNPDAEINSQRKDEEKQINVDLFQRETGLSYRSQINVQGPFSLTRVSLLAATLGSLEFSLLYEQENHSLHCCIVKAKVNTHGHKDETRRDETRQTR